MRYRILGTALAAVAAAAALVAPTAPASAAAPRPPAASNVYVLPGNDVFPEGSAVDQRTGTFWVSSLATGAVYRGTVGDPTPEVFLAPGGDGRTATVGLEYARGVLYVAGGGTGQVWAYDAYSGALLARLSTGLSGFVNDVAIGRDGAAYFTDSLQTYVYRVARTADGSWALERWLDLSGSVPYVAGAFNVNGIAASPSGRFLFIVNMTTGKLYRIDTRTKAVREVDVRGADLTAGDGLEVHGSTLYVVRNSAEEVVRLRLVAQGTRAYAAGTITDPSFRFPTTAEVLHGRLLVVNSQLDRLFSGGSPELPFTVSSVPLHRG
jgi:Cu-Zn family superoxide dismutase